MSKTYVRWRLLSAVAVLMAALGRPATAQAISNGGFESNGGAGTSLFTNWTVADQTGSAGSFYVQTGTGTPLFGNLVPPPPEGQFAAMTDAGGAGSHVLYQDFPVPSGIIKATVSFQVYVNNQAGDFVAANTLDYSPGPNQQARVDLLLAGSDPFSIASSDVLLNLFQTHPGDPLISGYRFMSADITGLLAGHGGDTLRLRFAEVDNMAPLNLGVDDVRLTIVPEPSTLPLLTACAITGAVYLSRRRHAR